MKPQNKHQRTIEVSIAPDGSLQINAVGFQGSDCEAATRYLEEALGMVGERTRKPEYSQRQRVQHQQRVGD